MSKKYKAKNATRALALPEPVQKAAPFIVMVLFFFLVCLNSVSTVRGSTMTTLILLAVTLVLCWKRLSARISLPLLALTLFVVMCGIASLYASAGKLALQEFLKILFSFCLALILMALAPKEEEKSGQWIGTVLAGGSALFSLVSVDLLSTRIISTPVLAFFGLFSNDFSSLNAVESGVRMTSLVDNPNVFSGIAGIGVLLCLGLAVSGTGKRKYFHLACLSINALAFVLAFSMGASAMIALAFVVYLLIERKDRRSDLLVLMVETLILTVLAVVPISMTSLQTWTGFNPIPLVCLIVDAVLLCLADKFLGRKVSGALRNKGKLLLILVAAILVAAIGFVVAAYNLTGGISMEAGETLRRSAYPEPGTYTLNAQVDGSVSVTIETQNQHDTMMHTSTVLYQGDLSGATFTVPEDSLVVYFNFGAAENVYLASADYSGDAGTGSIPLGYKLLPGFISNRIQGLFANQNAIQRFVFFEDGLKLFRRSPVIGLGLGSYESAIMSVQSFFYETKYAHNHYIQLLAETGIIGLALFLGLLVVCAIAILRSRKQEGGCPLIPALGAALVFMAGHAATEVVFSIYAYLPFAFGVFALINLCCADGFALPWLKKGVRTGILIAISAVLLVFAYLLGGNMYAKTLIKNNPSAQSFVRAADMDRYEWSSYALSYVKNIPEDAPDSILDQANEFAQRLAKLDSNTVPFRLAEFYFSTDQVEMGFEMAEKYVDYVASDAEAWQDTFDLLIRYAEDTDEFRDGLIRLVDKLNEWNANNMGKIVLDEDVLLFLDEMGV